MASRGEPIDPTMTLEIYKTSITLGRVEDTVSKHRMSIRWLDESRLRAEERLRAAETQVVELRRHIEEMQAKKSGPIEIAKLAGIIFSIVVSTISLLKAFGFLTLPWSH